MSQQIINIGAFPNDPASDPARTGFDKINQNFTELYGKVNSGIATIDFGATPTEEGSIAVTGQMGILATSNIQAFIVARSTIDNNETNHKFGAIALRLIVSDIVVGVGFTINAYSIIGLVTGTFKIDWRWS